MTQDAVEFLDGARKKNRLRCILAEVSRSFNRGWARLFLAENILPIEHSPDPNKMSSVEFLDLEQAVQLLFVVN
jgi:hypothetical protein